MRIVFMGSPDFAVPALRALLEHHEVVLVVTQPDKRAGRGKRMAAPPVKDVALAAGVPVIQPRSARPPEFADELRQTGADIGVVVAYGKILPKAVLDAFPRGCVNIHGSLLPAYRGAAPIQWSIIRGETETGVTIMCLDQGMDTGPILLERVMPIHADDTAGTLFERMAPIGAEALLDALDGLESGTLMPRPQDHERASYAPMLTKEDGVIDWTQRADQVAARIRGVDPWPGAETQIAGQRIKLFGAEVVDEERSAAPGQVLGVDARGLLVSCGQGAIAVRALQAPGKRRLPATAFVSGRPMPAGTMCERPAAPGQESSQEG